MRTRRYLAVGVITFTCYAGPMMGAAPASAAEEVVAASCATAVQGTSGRQVVLSPDAVVEPIVGVLGPLDPLGVLVAPFRLAWNTLPPIPVGTVPVGESVISGVLIADAVVDRLREIPVVAPVLEPLIPAVRAVLSTTCALLVRDDKPDDPGAGAPAPSNPGASPSQPGGSSSSPYGRTPGAPAPSEYPAGKGARLGVPISSFPPYGIAVKYNAAGVPQSGVLGANSQKADSQQAAVLNAQRSPGTAQSLPLEEDRLSQPVLLAVLLLTLVSAQLVRTWVLRPQR